METSKHKKFNIQVQSGKLSEKTLEITVHETTDGIPYYNTTINTENIQLRKDGKWELIWGQLDATDIEAIGKEIDQQIKTGDY